MVCLNNLNPKQSTNVDVVGFSSLFALFAITVMARHERTKMKKGRKKKKDLQTFAGFVILFF